MDSVCEGGSHFGLPLTFAPQSVWGLPADSWNLRGSLCSSKCALARTGLCFYSAKHPSRHELSWVSNASSFSAASPSEKHEFIHRWVKVCRISCWKPLLLSSPGLNPRPYPVCEWYQANKETHQIFWLLREDVLLPSELMDEGCVVSARCVRTMVWCTSASSFGSQRACGIFPFIAAECVSSSRCCLRRPGSNPGYDRLWIIETGSRLCSGKRDTVLLNTKIEYSSTLTWAQISPLGF